MPPFIVTGPRPVDTTAAGFVLPGSVIDADPADEHDRQLIADGVLVPGPQPQPAPEPDAEPEAEPSGRGRRGSRKPPAGQAGGTTTDDDPQDGDAA